MKNYCVLIVLTLIFTTGCDFMTHEAGEMNQIKVLSHSVTKGDPNDVGEVTTAVFEFEFEVIGGDKMSYLVLHADTAEFGGVQYKLNSASSNKALLYSDVSTNTAIVRNEGKSDVATIIPGRRHTFTFVVEVEAADDDFYRIEMERITFRDRAPVTMDYASDSVYLNGSDRAQTVINLKKMQKLLYTAKKLASKGEHDDAQELVNTVKDIGDSLTESVHDSRKSLLDSITTEIQAGSDDSIALMQQVILLIELEVLRLLGEDYYR